MNPHTYEDAAWERLKDLQREMENRRLLISGAGHGLRSSRRLIAQAWRLAGLTVRRPSRQRPVA